MRQNLLVRHYIGRRLSEYYAQPADRVVGKSSGAETAKLSSHWGEWHWRRLLRRFYEEREGHWLTPVELFQPHFSHILGDFCCQAVTAGDNNDTLEIVELGGGRGTNAKLLLNYLKDHRPDIYKGVTYTLVDSSPTLHELQRSILTDTEHANKVDFRLLDLVNVAERRYANSYDGVWNGLTCIFSRISFFRQELLSASEKPTVVLAMEVLDNLPHDKIQQKSRKQLQQAEIHPQGDKLKETFVPLVDPLLARVIQAVPAFAKPYPTWIPTVACGILEHVIQQRPNLGLAFADFDWLPAPDLMAETPSRLTSWGEGEPIITDMQGVDHECFLQAPPHCDILFPTDFDKLASFTKRTMAGSKRTSSTVRVDKQADFLERYGARHVQETKSWLSGHTPLLQDFVNCSVLSITTHQKP